jgi:hypothetical protein
MTGKSPDSLLNTLRDLYNAANNVFLDACDREETQPEYKEDERDDMPVDEDGTVWYQDWFSLKTELEVTKKVLEIWEGDSHEED